MTLVDRSPDLSRLVADGYDIEVRDGNLLIHHVPYVNGIGKVDHCILVSDLSTNAERTIAPSRHEVWVVGDIPHDHQGNKITIIADEDGNDYGNGLIASCRLSGKPGGQMPVDYYQKMSNYIKVLGQYARAIDSTATHEGYPPRQTSPEESVFCYHDSATSRAGLSAVTGKLKVGKVAIVGLGGTGSYVLDLVAKTPVIELHLYDDDVFFAHNAFRAPGAATFDDVAKSLPKVDYFAGMYSQFRRNIAPHPVRVTEENVDELLSMDFVFLTMDAGPSKRVIVERLKAHGVSFIDCGMGIQRQDNSLRGIVRVTTGTKGHFGHLDRRISYTDVGADEYDWNIQTADLNMLNAAMAVLKWKKLCGYYIDSKNEFNSQFTVARNQLHNGEVAE